MKKVIFLGILASLFFAATFVLNRSMNLGLILIAAFSYPLGNRKMMECCPPEFSTFQRVFGMTLCSMPFWLVICFLALSSHNLPSFGQTVQGFLETAFPVSPALPESHSSWPAW